jgi:hypothetical protein
MRTRLTASSGVVSAETVVAFEQRGDVVSAAYRGGRVLAGYLVGRLAGQRLRFRYVQTDVDGALDAGVSDAVVERLPDGRHRLTEHFQWTTRPESGTNVFEEMIAEGEDAMVSIAKETAEQARRRLRRVIQQARLKVFEGVWTFEDFPLAELPTRVSPLALALVRDEDVWSQLVPYRGNGEPLTLFRFHFPPDADNSGFVGWLATLIKETFGSGVVVTCGSNSRAGGIFDYWAVPASIGAAVTAMVVELVGGR